MKKKMLTSISGKKKEVPYCEDEQSAEARRDYRRGLIKFLHLEDQGAKGPKSPLRRGTASC